MTTIVRGAHLGHQFVPCWKDNCGPLVALSTSLAICSRWAVARAAESGFWTAMFPVSGRSSGKAFSRGVEVCERLI